MHDAPCRVAAGRFAAAVHCGMFLAVSRSVLHILEVFQAKKYYLFHMLF